MDGRMDGRTDGWMDVRMNRWTDGQMDLWIEHHGMRVRKTNVRTGIQLVIRHRSTVLDSE